MTHAWILDVLTDLEAYAKANELEDLAEGLSSASAIALSELALAEPHIADAVTRNDLGAEGFRRVG